MRALLAGQPPPSPAMLAAAADAIATDPRLRHRAEGLVRTGRIRPGAAARLAEALAGAGQDALSAAVVDAGLAYAPRDGRLHRLALPRLAGTASRERLAATGRSILRDDGTELATLHALWRAARQAREQATSDAAAAAIEARQDGSAAAALWLGRLRREAGDEAGAMAAFRAAAGTAADPDGRRTALRNAALLAVRRDRLAEDAPLILAAVDEGAVDDPNVAAVAGMIRARTAPLGSAAVAAFDHLRAHGLPDRPYADAQDRVLLVASSLACGGMERVLAATVRGLRARGQAADLALSRFDPAGPSAFFLGQSGLVAGEVIALADPGIPDPLVATLPRPYLAEAQGALAAITRLRPRAVHIWNDRLGLIAGFAALRAGCPRVIVHFHHMRPTRDEAERESARHYPELFRILLDRPEFRFAFCADAAADDYADFWQVRRDPARMVTVHNGFAAVALVAPAERTAARVGFGIPADAPVIASLFRFEPVKQPLAWIAAAGRIATRRPDCRFLMAGDGELLAGARDAAAAAGLADRMIFPGRLGDVRPALAATDLLMMSSASEGLPNGAVEAQLAGVPLVAFDVGGVRETCLPGRTGRLVAPDAVDALADRAVDWLNDRPALARAGAEAARFAADAFGMDRYLDALTALYG